MLGGWFNGLPETLQVVIAFVGTCTLTAVLLVVGIWLSSMIRWK